MLKKFKIFIWTLILFGSVSCVDNDNIGPIEKLTSSNLIFLREMLFGTKKLSKLQKIGVCISSIKMSTAHT